MSAFAAIHVILAPTAAVDYVALLLHIQQFPSFTAVVGAGYAIGEFASVFHCLCLDHK